MVYTLKHRNIDVCDITFHEGNLISIQELYNKNHLPAGVVSESGKINTRNIEEWWNGRGIPKSREGFDDVLKLVHLRDKNELLIRSLGLSLTDHYWVCPGHISLDWDEVNFYDNGFSPDIGDIFFHRGKKGGHNLMTPDNSSDGRRVNRGVMLAGARVLNTGGSPGNYQEPFNEVLASSIMRRLGISLVEYSLYEDGGEYFSGCTNMTDTHVELVYASHIYETRYKNINDNYYSHYIKCGNGLGVGVSGIESSLDRMMAVDYLIANTDRHFNNFGMLRNSRTLEYTGPAPLFDSGTSLWHDKNAKDIRADAPFRTRCFADTHEEQIRLVRDFSWYDRKKLAGIGEECMELLQKNRHFDGGRKKKIAGSLTERVDMLERVIEQSMGVFKKRNGRNGRPEMGR
jgi:hypothetical protein